MHIWGVWPYRVLNRLALSRSLNLQPEFSRLMFKFLGLKRNLATQKGST